MWKNDLTYDWLILSLQGQGAKKSVLHKDNMLTIYPRGISLLHTFTVYIIPSNLPFIKTMITQTNGQRLSSLHFRKNNLLFDLVPLLLQLVEK